jgi:Concanavalin A-like lectin/glucanases superfamily
VRRTIYIFFIGTSLLTKRFPKKAGSDNPKI